MTQISEIRRKILEENDREAIRLHEQFTSCGTLVINLISSPGSGKTSLLEQLISQLRERFTTAVLVGDVATERDADRIRALDVPAHQIITGGACHLDARLVSKGLEEAAFGRVDMLFVENVGNLVCPASYDVGEDFKMALLSAPEGDDKPFKYPAIFTRAEVTVISKSDLLPVCDFDLETVHRQLAFLRPNGRIFVTSAKTGEGIAELCGLFEDRLAAKLGVTV